MEKKWKETTADSYGIALISTEETKTQTYNISKISVRILKNDKNISRIRLKNEKNMKESTEQTVIQYNY
jgi:hypothetical protein